MANTSLKQRLLDWLLLQFDYTLLRYLKVFNYLRRITRALILKHLKKKLEFKLRNILQITENVMKGILSKACLKCLT